MDLEPNEETWNVQRSRFIRIMTATGPCQPRRGLVIPDVTQALMDKHVATIKKESAKNNNVKMEILEVYEMCQIFTY